MKYMVPITALAITLSSFAAASPQLLAMAVPDQILSIATKKRDLSLDPATVTKFHSQLLASTTAKHSAHGTGTGHHPYSRNGTAVHHHSSFAAYVTAPAAPTLSRKTAVSPIVVTESSPSRTSTYSTSPAKSFPANASPIVMTESSPNVFGTFKPSQASPLSTESSVAASGTANPRSTTTIIVTAPPPTSMVTAHATATHVTVQTVTVEASASATVAPKLSVREVRTHLVGRELSVEGAERIFCAVAVSLLFVGIGIGCCLDPRCRHSWAWRKEHKKRAGLRDLELGRGAPS